MVRRRPSLRTPLIGREPVLDLLWSEVDAAAREGCRVAVVRGPAGIGKTRLLEEFAARARELGAVVVAGRSSALGGYPYGALADALAAYVRSSAPAAAAIRRAGAPLARLVPALVADDDEALIEPSLPAVVQSAYRLVAQLTERRPLVLALDDVHAADAETCEVLHALHRHARDHGWLLLLGLRRPGDGRDTPGRRLVEALRREEGAADVELQPLDAAGTAALATAVLGEGLPGAALVEMLQRRTAGNPFYVEEMVRWLRGAGHLRREGLQWLVQPGGEEGVPPGIEEALGERIAALEPAQRAVLEWLCAAGGRAEPALVAEVAGLDGAALDAAVDALVPAQLATAEAARGGELRVHHPLIAECVDRETTVARRRLAHRALALALSRRGAAAAVVARHFAECAEPGDDEAVAAALDAAGDAERALHLARAASWYQQALALMPADHPRRAAALDRLSGLASQIGRPDVALAAARELLARTADDEASRRVVLLGRLAALGGAGGHPESTRAALDEAIALAERGDAGVARMLVELCMVATTVLPATLALDAVRRARSAAAGLDDVGRGVAVMLRGIESYTLAYAGRPARAAAACVAAGTVAMELGDGIALGFCMFSRAVANLILGRFADSAEALQALGEATEQGGLLWETVSIWSTRAEALLGLGRFDEALADALRAEEFARREQGRNMVDQALLAGAQALVLRGDLDAAAVRLAAARSLLDQGVSVFEGAYWAVRALLDEAGGDMAAAAAGYEHMRRWTADAGYRWTLCLQPFEVFARLQCGEAGAALALAREVMAAIDPGEMPRALAPAHVALGAALVAAGEVGAGVEEVERGVGMVDAVDGPLLPAQARLHAGAALLAAGERRRGVELLQSAHQAFTAMGAPWLRGRCQALLRDAGVAVAASDAHAAPAGAQRDADDPLAALSAREREVAVLAMSGASSRTMATRLGISERTVENHLANLYAKLGVHSRAELIALQARLQHA